MSEIRRIVEDIVAKKLLKKKPAVFKHRKEYIKLKEEFVKVFNEALKNIKPIRHGKMLWELFENAAPWISYNKFNWKKYLRAADDKFYQLKTKLKKHNIELQLEYNMTFNQMWISSSIDLNNSNLNNDDDLVLFDSELYLDTIFYNEILDAIFNTLDVYPIVLEKCFPQMSDDFELKAWNRNWDT